MCGDREGGCVTRVDRGLIEKVTWSKDVKDMKECPQGGLGRSIQARGASRANARGQESVCVPKEAGGSRG